jgi:ribosomal protein S18 acetylase RimI-like enzyme
MNPEVRFRLFQEEDFSAVCSMEQGEKGSPYCAAVFIRQASVIFAPLFFVVVVDGQPAGYIIGAILPHSPKDGWILRLKVTPSHRRKGLGTDLVVTLVRALEEAGVTRVSLTVAPDNIPAAGLYRARGFKELGIVPDYFGSGEDRILMSLTLPLRDIP